MARGSVHPSEVLRAVMMELEAIGLEVKGAEVDKRLAQTEATLSLSAAETAVAVYKARSLQSEGALQGSTGHTDNKTFNGVDSGLTVSDSKVIKDVNEVPAAENTLASTSTSHEGRYNNSGSLIVAAVTDIQDVESVSPTLLPSMSSNIPDADTAAISPILPPLPPSFINQQLALPSSTPTPTTSLAMLSPAPAVPSVPSSSDCKSIASKSLAHTIAEHSEDLETKHSVSRSASAVSVTFISDTPTHCVLEHIRVPHYSLYNYFLD